MKVFTFVQSKGCNFGDDLNRWIWERLLGRPLSVDDGTLLLGIGTVIVGDILPSAKNYIVLSSGAGYGRPPVGFGGPNWKILSVRGPLTAAALGLPSSLAITDGAALLRLLPECAPLPAAERAGIVFMPHYASLSAGNWKQACEMAGLEFLDPYTDSERAVQRIRRARLVVADAMHAAIVADALRVPWIPAVLSPQSSTFKWLDWSGSLNLKYSAIRVPASTFREFIRTKSFWFYGEKEFLEDGTPEAALAHFERMIWLRSRKLWPTWRWRIQELTCQLPQRIIGAHPISGLLAQPDQAMTNRAAECLRRIAESPSYLSEDRIIISKVDQLASLLPMLH